MADTHINALHGPSTSEQAEKELKKFFPMEQTIALIKPGTSAEQKAQIEAKIEQSGFIIASKKSSKLTADIAKDIYKDSSNTPHYNDLINMMTSGDTEILVLSRENAIEGWREAIGPTDPHVAKEKSPNSLRALYGVDVLNNALHGPSSKQQAEHELNMFFGGAKFDESGNATN